MAYKHALDVNNDSVHSPTGAVFNGAKANDRFDLASESLLHSTMLEANNDLISGSYIEGGSQFIYEQLNTVNKTEHTARNENFEDHM